MSVQELLLLGLLAEGETHGYELHELLAEKLEFMSDLTRPTAYRLLDRLHREGCLSRELERAGKRPERMRYRITEPGRVRLDALLAQTLSSVDVLKPAGNVALLFIERLPRREASRLLALRKAALVQGLARVTALYSALPSQDPARLVLSRNQALMEADIAWMARTIRRLARDAERGDDRHEQQRVDPRRAGERKPGRGQARKKARPTKRPN